MWPSLQNRIFIYCTLSTLWKYTQQIDVTPHFWSLPDPEIYVDSSSRHIRIQVLVSPPNTTLVIGMLSIRAGGHSDDIQLLDLVLTHSTLSSDGVRVLVQEKMIVGESQSQEKWTMDLINWGTVIDRSLHILAINALGTVASRPFKIVRKVLNPFPLVHHDSVEFLMGNVGQIVCMIPHSKPSPPQIEFMHDNVSINITAGSRYKKVYLHSGAVVLLIKSITQQDAGSYTCTASLPNTTSFQKSDKVTVLSVLVPKKNLKPRFRLSSHDNERGGQSRVIEVVEGWNITLYCLYQSAPVSDVSWYWPNSNRKYEVDFQFGTIFIPNVQKEDSSEFSCSVDDVAGRTLSLRVIELPRFTSTPFEISFENNFNKSVGILCEMYNTRSRKNIKWFHNGRIMNERAKKIQFIDNVLSIHSLTEEDLGIYQCWLENEGGLWATGVTVIKRMERVQDALSYENNSFIDKRTSSGLTIHLECSLDQTYVGSITDFTVKWFRRTNFLEPIDLNGNKYIMFNKKSEKKVILSIVNPTKNQDEGIYVCRLYGIHDNLLRTAIFRLNIDDLKPGDLSPFEINRAKISVKKNLVSAPEVSKLNDYVPALHLRWKLLPSNKQSVQIFHYRILYQRKLYMEKLTKKETIDERKSEEWSDEEKMIDEYATSNEITIVDRQMLRSSSQIRFRVIAIPKVNSPMPSVNAENETIIDNLSSNWSNAIDFKNLLNCKLSISRTKTKAPTILEVMWTHTCVRESHWQNIAFHVLYSSISQCVKIKKCPQDSVNIKSYESILILPEFRSLLHSIRIDREFGEFFQANITNLTPDTEYAIGIYGKLTSMSQEVAFISLSNVINVTTAKLTSNFKINGNRQTNISEGDDARNRVIFLVLGSLAGVLFVVAAVMFGMCVWYYLRKHISMHKAQMKMNNAHQPGLLFPPPSSSMSSPVAYGNHQDSIIPYKSPLTNPNNRFVYYAPQNIENSPINSSSTRQKELWPTNFFGHSPNRIDISDRFHTDRESDLDSMTQSDTMMKDRNLRRNVVMGADQASSTYSRVGSERRMSMGQTNIMPGEYPNSFQNLTLPRHCTIPISFPEPPKDDLHETFLFKYPPASSSATEAEYYPTNVNRSSIPFVTGNSKSMLQSYT